MASKHAETIVYDVDDSTAVSIPPRSGRKGLLVLNETGEDVYILFDDDGTVTSGFKSGIIGDRRTYEMLGDSVYAGAIEVIAADGGDGRVSVTEFYG